MKLSRIVIAGTAVLAACGLVGTVRPAAQASSSPALTWTRQATPVHPPARTAAAMAYDAATGTVVLFGGQGRHGVLADTWTWNGTTWTKQHPAVHPSARTAAAMAYNAATGTVVLFGGGDNRSNGYFADTWTWNGSTWTKRAPASSPLARAGAAMAYDAATGTVVLFGGYHNGALGDTWTWNGTTWAPQTPASSPAARWNAAMAYDAATGTAVLAAGFVDNGGGHYPNDTWTWDGTTWAAQSALPPPDLIGASMAYDAATGAAVLFGGQSPGIAHANTWTWDGTWTQQTPAAHPSARANAAMTYDAATRTVVLFGGLPFRGGPNADTWTWGMTQS